MVGPDGPVADRQAQPISPKGRLAQALRDRSGKGLIREAYCCARREYGEQCLNSTFLAEVLARCGFKQRFSIFPSCAVGLLLSSGWRLFYREMIKPQPTDIYVGIGDNFRMEHLGFVSGYRLPKAGEPIQSFFSVDELCVDTGFVSYERPILGSDRYYDVGYWLRWPG